MSYGGVAIWDIKYGVPQSHEEAWDIEQKISNLDEEANPALQAVAQALQQFAKQACAYYDDDAIHRYQDIEDWQLEGPVVWYGEIQPELSVPFSVIIVKTAIEHGLVAMYHDLEMVFLPDGRTYVNDLLVEDGVDSLEYEIEKWQIHLVYKTIQQGVDKYTKAHTLAITKTQTNEDETVCCVDFARVQVELKIEVDTGYLKITDDGIEMDFYASCNVTLKDVSDDIRWYWSEHRDSEVEIDLSEIEGFQYISEIEDIDAFPNPNDAVHVQLSNAFNDYMDKITEERRKLLGHEIELTKVALQRATRLDMQFYNNCMLQDPEYNIIVHSIDELQDRVAQALAMFQKICNISHDLYRLFNFMHRRYTQGDPNQPLHSVQSLQVEKMLFLAKLTKQPNYNELVEFYRPLVARDDLLEIIRDAVYDKKFTYTQLENVNSVTDIIELLGLPDYALAQKDKMYDKYIAYLNTLNVDAIWGTHTRKDLSRY